MPFLASSGAAAHGRSGRRRSGRDRQVDRATKGYEQSREADQAEASEPAVFESRDRRLVHAAEPFELSLRVAQSEARAADDEPEVSQAGDLTGCKRLSLRPHQRTIHAAHGSTEPFANGSRAIRQDCTNGSPDAGYADWRRHLRRNMQRTASQKRS